MVTFAVEPETCSDAIVSRILEEFDAMPGLRLTRPQFRRLWNLPVAECDALLGRLTACGMLAQDATGRYVRVGTRP